MMSTVTYIIDGEILTEAEFAKQLRDKYSKNPPEGYTAKEILGMRDEDILDMDYFLNE